VALNRHLFYRAEFPISPFFPGAPVAKVAEHSLARSLPLAVLIHPPRRFKSDFQLALFCHFAILSRRCSKLSGARTLGAIVAPVRLT
jgi:hypothetical protein